VVIESLGTTFTSALDTSSLILANVASSLRVGKSTNTANVTLGPASVAGPISVFGGKIQLSNDLSVSTSDTLQLIASKDIVASSGVDLSTQGGNIVLSANSDGAAGGAILMSGASVRSYGGNITLGGGSDGAGYTVVCGWIKPPSMHRAPLPTATWPFVEKVGRGLTGSALQQPTTRSVLTW
jgi:hypothetical protein